MQSNFKWVMGLGAALSMSLVGGMAIADLREELASPPRAEMLAMTPAVAEAKPAPSRAEPVPAPKDTAFTVERVLPIAGPIKYGEWHWDDANVPDGPLVVTVDLDARVISVFRNGYEIGTAAVMLGTYEHPTPLGHLPDPVQGTAQRVGKIRQRPDALDAASDA